MGYDSDHPLARGEVGKVGVAIATIDDMRIADRRASRWTASPISMTINSTAADPPRPVVAVARERGIAGAAVGHRAERPAQGVHRARDVHLSAARLAEASRPTSSRSAPREVPRWNTISISGYHMREAGSTAVQEVAFTLANALAYVRGRARPRPRDRRLRAAALVLLQRALELLRGGRQVPGGAAPVGARSRGTASARKDPALLAPPLPHADRGLDAHGAAARRQRRPRRARRRCPPCSAARSRSTPTPWTRRWRFRPRSPRGWPCAPSRSSPTRQESPTSWTRSAAPTSWRPGRRRSATRARALIAQDRRAGRRGRAIERGFFAAGDPGGRLPAAAGDRRGEAADRGRQRVPRGEGADVRRSCRSIPPRSGADRAPAGVSGLARRLREPRGARGAAARRAEDRNLMPALVEAVSKRATLGRSSRR